MKKENFDKLNSAAEMSKLSENVKVDFTRAKFALEKFKRQLAHLPKGAK